MSLHLLRCSCGRELTVSSRHAGQARRCDQCGAEVQVPTMLELRQLPVAEAATAERSDIARSTEGITRSGCLFGLSGGLFLLAASAAVVLFWMAYAQYPRLTAEQDIAFGNRQIDQLTPAERLEYWAEFEKLELENPVPPYYVVARQQAERYRGAGFMAAAVALIALVAVLWQVIHSARQRSR